MGAVVPSPANIEAFKRARAVQYWADSTPRIVAGHRLQAPIDTGLLRATHALEPPERIFGGFRLRLVIHAPYAKVVHGGHGFIYPKTAKALRWVTKEGQVVFAARVRPVPANPWTVRAWKQMGFKKVKLVLPLSGAAAAAGGVI
jgi:hypothetical protein